MVQSWWRVDGPAKPGAPLAGGGWLTALQVREHASSPPTPRSREKTITIGLRGPRIAVDATEAGV